MVQVLSSNGDWDHVIFNDKEGYIFNYFLSDDGNPPGGYDFEYFKTDMTRFVNDNNIKSPTNNLITTDLENKITYIFKKGDNKLWILLYKWSCTVGKPETPTIKGTFYVTEIINDTLGATLSHGCIRLAVENAQWIYNNILDTTAIIIN